METLAPYEVKLMMRFGLIYKTNQISGAAVIGPVNCKRYIKCTKHIYQRTCHEKHKMK